MNLKSQYKNISIIILTTVSILISTYLWSYINFSISNIQELGRGDYIENNYNQSNVDRIISAYHKLEGNNKFIISTEKDIMRLSLPEILKKLQNIPIFYISIEIRFHDNDKMEFDNQIIEYVTKNK